MIRGLAITPPVLGRISIGRVIERNGKRLPEKDDQFTLTSQIQSREGWIAHPYDAQLRAQTENGKLRSIPVMMLFNEPDLNFRAEYSLFDRKTGRPACVGDGAQCRRYTASGMEQLPCPSPDYCEMGGRGQCKPYGRLNVRVGEDSGLGSFIFRTTGFNSIRTILARLHYYQAVSGGLLACLPLELKIRGKSTTQSHRSAIYYVDLDVREGMTLEECIAQAKSLDQHRRATGYDQQALDQAARAGLANAAFEDDREDIPDIISEFFPEESGQTERLDGVDGSTVDTGNLSDKLKRKSEAVAA
ncbi:MAG: hypothetical protein RBS57_18595 [Desulforhabdus sp.]|jgi:hypothetical protein|nr:hypothetical protein [Desulforhabdus sp.]